MIAAVALLAIGAFQRRRAATRRSDTALVAAALATLNQPDGARAVQQRCATLDACACLELAVRAQLDLDLHAAAIDTLTGARPRICSAPKSAANLTGERAEAAARAGASEAARKLVATAQAANPESPYAELALARLAYDHNEMLETAKHADLALKYGRGAEAERLLGRASLALGKFEDARTHFENQLLGEPRDVEASFSSAVCSDKLGHYHDARESLLRTLRLDPKHVLARYYLVVLTHSVGADAEARHNLQKLSELVPKDDARVVELGKLLNAAAGDAGAPIDGGSASLGVAPSGDGKINGHGRL
jgi:tetratricopeptide (TPR) repeat protein